MSGLEALAILERIAGAIRQELGESIDAYPGGGAPGGADPMNRAFQAVTRCLLETGPAPGEEPASQVSRALRLLADRRLAGEGWDGRKALLLIEAEPGAPDDWLAFLLLSSRAQLEPLLDRRG
jgi:hypothetical protein